MYSSKLLTDEQVIEKRKALHAAILKAEEEHKAHLVKDNTLFVSSLIDIYNHEIVVQTAEVIEIQMPFYDVQERADGFVEPFNLELNKRHRKVLKYEVRECILHVKISPIDYKEPVKESKCVLS